MGLLRPYQRDNSNDQAAGNDPVAPAPDAEEVSEVTTKGPRKKSGPTPTRAEAERARMDRLHPNLTPKERKQAEREAKRALREERYEAQLNTPEKTLMRDYVDARWTITEFLLPTMLVLVAVSFMFSRNALVQSIIMGVMVFLLLSWFGNVWWAWRGFKAEANQRIKNPRFQGLLLEMNSRMMSIRRFRNPGPRINRGDSY
ncbi:DUF3043 domain-containing protein [Propionibacteriaceae bacterium Y1923]